MPCSRRSLGPGNAGCPRALLSTPHARGAGAAGSCRHLGAHAQTAPAAAMAGRCPRGRIRRRRAGALPGPGRPGGAAGTAQLARTLLAQSPLDLLDQSASVNRTQASGELPVQRLPVRRTATMVANAAAAPQPKTAGSGIQWARLQGCRHLGAHVVVRHIWSIHSRFLLIPRQDSVLIPIIGSVPNLKLFNGIQCTPTDLHSPHIM